MQIGRAKITVILSLSDHGRQERYEAEEYKYSPAPHWMALGREQVVSIKFGDTRCYNEIQNRQCEYGEKLMWCHIFFVYDNEIRVCRGKIVDYFPTTLSVIGEIRIARVKEIEAFKIVPDHILEKMKEDNMIKDSSLSRFEDIDLED